MESKNEFDGHNDVIRKPFPSKKRTHIHDEVFQVPSDKGTTVNPLTSKNVVLLNWKSDDIKKQKCSASSSVLVHSPTHPVDAIHSVRAKKKAKIAELRKMLEDSVALGKRAQTLCSHLMELSKSMKEDNEGKQDHVPVENAALQDDDIVLGLLRHMYKL